MKRTITILLISVMLLYAIAMPVFANSAIKDFSGASSNGVITTAEGCPITVEKEVLTLDITQFPDNYYSDVEAFLAYTGKVSAEYTFHNPTAEAVNATLVFPFGSIPDYANYEFIYNADVQKYDITVNGQPIEKRLRISFSSETYNFNLEKDLQLLLDNYITDSFYSPALPVTKYTYTVSGVDAKTYRDACATVDILESSYSGNKIYLEDTVNINTLKSGIQRLYTYAENGEQIHLYIIGATTTAPEKWNIYESSLYDAKKISGSVTLTDTETLTFGELIRSKQGTESGISEMDYYNTTVAYLNDYFRDESIVGSLDINGNFLRWYEYDLSIPAGGQVVNTVTAPLYPDIDGHYEPPIYSYTYLLSPAKSWASFGSLEIIINTPYHLIESELEGFKKTDTGYKLTRTGLPEKELKFTLSESENPKREFSAWTVLGILFIILPFIAVIVITAVIITIIIVLVRRFKKRKQNM